MAVKLRGYLWLHSEVSQLSYFEAVFLLLLLLMLWALFSPEVGKQQQRVYEVGMMRISY